MNVLSSTYCMQHSLWLELNQMNVIIPIKSYCILYQWQKYSTFHHILKLIIHCVLKSNGIVVIRDIKLIFNTRTYSFFYHINGFSYSKSLLLTYCGDIYMSNNTKIWCKCFEVNTDWSFDLRVISDIEYAYIRNFITFIEVIHVIENTESSCWFLLFYVFKGN